MIRKLDDSQACRSNTSSVAAFGAISAGTVQRSASARALRKTAAKF
jgi:hypothetical protein